MPNVIKNIPLYVLIAINLLMIMAMIFCAYTSFLPPQTYPNWSYFGLMFPVFVVANIGFVLFWLLVKRRIVVLPVVGMLMCAGSIRTYCPINLPSDPPEGSLKVLTYNVMAFGTDRAADWKDNAIVNYIIDCDADFVCLQEAMKSNTGDAFDVLQQKYPYQDMQSNSNNYLAFLSKYPILSAEQIMYTSVGNYSFAYEVKVDEDTLIVVNNHLESYRMNMDDRDKYKDLVKHPKSDDAKVKYKELVEKLVAANAVRGPQVDSVAAYVEKKAGRHIIACGDFNDPSISYTHRRLTEHLNDAYTRSGNGPGISYNLSGMYFRIDNILCSPNITPYGAVVDNFMKESDHYPMCCFLKLE